MSDDDYRLEKRIQKIKNSEKLDNKTCKFLTEKYLTEIQRTGADSSNTQEIYLRRLFKILQQENLSIQQIQNWEQTQIEKWNNKIIDNIQKSKYRANPGDYSKRTKRSYWSSWKRMLQTIGHNTDNHKKYMPVNVQFSTTQKGKKKLTPQDLPNSRQVKQFLKTLGEISSPATRLRNQAMIGLIWDAGPRIGEIIEDDEDLETIKMQQVTVRDDRVLIKVKGNKNKTQVEKERSNRKVEIFQCRKLLQDYIEQHPKRNDPDAFLFYPSKNNQHHSSDKRFYTCCSKGPIRRKVHQTRRKADLSFVTENNPFHIFRKGMITYYVMNDILSWEKVCERTGKDPSATLPIYLKMAMDDINASAAESFGLDSETRDSEHRMIGSPLLPKKCSSCGRENRCYRDLCQGCGAELPESEMPHNLEKDAEEQLTRYERLAKQFEKNPENVLKTLEDELE